MHENGVKYYYMINNKGAEFMNKKSLLALVMCILMVFMLVACAGEKESSEEKQNSDENASEQEEVKEVTDNRELSEDEQKALDTATEENKNALEKNAADAAASVELSRKYAEYGQYTDAAKTIKQAITYATDNTELYDELMEVYQQSGNTAEALSYIDTISDDAMRRKYIDEAYDRNSENALVMGNTMGNLTVGGMIAFDGDTVYYCDAANGKKLTKLQNGTSTVIVESSTEYLNIIGDYIYFVDRADYCIYKVKKDGSERTKVSDVMATNLIIFGNKMYFINWADECKVYSMNIDGSGLTKVSDMSTEVLYIYGPYIYITDRNNQRELYRVSIEDGSSYMISMDITYFVTGYDNNLFFRAEMSSMYDDWSGSGQEQGANLAVYRMTTDGTVYEPINNARSGYLNADKGVLYFTNFEEEALYKVNADGTGLTKLTDGDPAYTSVNGDYLYYFSDSDGKKLYRIRKDGTGKECLN